MTTFCSGTKWNSLSPSKKQEKILFNLIQEEDILNISEAKYLELLDRDPLGTLPVQDLVTNIVARTSNAVVEYLTSLRERNMPWITPIASLGPTRVAQLAIETMINELYYANRGESLERGFIVESSLVEYASVVRAISRDITFFAKYHSAKDQNRGAWVLANRCVSKNWTKRSMQNFIKTHSHSSVPISNRDRLRLGMHLTFILEKAGVIHTITRREGQVTKKYVAFTDEVIGSLVLGHRDSICRAHLRYVPMIVPPTRHTADAAGGAHTEYLRKGIVKTSTIYYKGDKFMTEYKSSEPSPKVINALNKLMSVEWCVNSKVLDVMEVLYKSNSSCCGLPPSEQDPMLFNNDFAEGEYRMTDERRQAWDAWYKSCGHRLRIQSLLRSARDLEAQDFFYHVWTCDFRGRAYPTSEILSPQSGDTDRGLLLFANPYKRTSRSEYWLKVQIANLFGHDKISRSKRVKWVDDNMAMLKAINDDPLSHIGAWEDDAAKKNTSFQRLANIFELFRTDGLLQIPIYIDGSCNGYQHWAAMMRDTEIAKLVNLTPADSPGDIYSVVAKLTTEELQVDIDRVWEYKNVPSMQWCRVFLDYWDGSVPRSVVKRAVMTDPYGVTPYGMQQGLINDKKLEWVGDVRTIPLAASALTEYLIRAMERLLVNPNRAKKWLHKVTRMFAERNIHASWVTPSLFKVKHEYNGQSSVDILIQGTSNLDITTATRFNEFDRSIVDCADAVNGISPNFVHSLDASHMIAVVNRIGEMCDNLAFVHDSYGTSADMVDTLICITQEEFVNIHKHNQLEILKEQWEEQLGFELPDLPPQGDLDINSVLESEYFFH